ncbi:MAG: hypothetical protein GY870_04440, partial [archaeon]|nr:hypothetical protein [archaeon]
MGKNKFSDWRSEFDQVSIKFTQGDFMFKLLATIDQKERPHLTMIACQGAKTPNEFVWGQFTQGTSKKNVLKNPKQGVFIMTAELSIPIKFIRAKIKYTHFLEEGEDVEMFSRIPLIKYNTYVNIFRAFYSEVISVTPINTISLIGMGKGIIGNLIAKKAAKDKMAKHKLSPWAFKLINDPLSFKFLGYIDPSDGYPIVIPCMQLCA